MTTLMVNIRDDKKVSDVVSFLRDIDFLEVFIKNDETNHPVRRSPAKELIGTRILGDITGPVVPESDWEALCEPAS